MAETASRTSSWEKRNKTVIKPHKKFRALTAASTEIDVNDKTQAQTQRMLRQNWQLQAWTVFDSLPELSYPLGFLSHCAGRMKIFAAAYPITGDTDNPIPINSPLLGAPPEVIQACQNAMADLGNGKLAIKNIMETLSLNLSVTGEAFLLGLTDVETLQQVWSVRSVSEIVIYNDQIKLREGPMTNTGVLGLIDLPEDTMVERMWQPHAQFRLLAQSPMRALVQTCEDLLMMRRTIRATGKSRLAGRGILFLPSELDVPGLNDDQGSFDADDFLSTLSTAMMTPIANEGSPAGVVPLVVQAPGDQIANIKWIDFASAFDAQSSAVRTELINGIATGLDLPREIVIGMTDLNHWSAFVVSADTFRNHVEPHVISIVECLTGAFLRPYFATCGLDKSVVDEWLQRILFWYDPTELVTPADLSANAQSAHDSLVLSDAALRKYKGFTDDDAPSPAEIEVRMIRTMRTWPANVVMALLHELDPELAVPPMVGPPELPGVKPGATGGVDVPAGPVVPGAAPAPLTTSPPVAAAPSPIENGPTPPDAIVSSGQSETEKQTYIRILRSELTKRMGYDPYAQTSSEKSLRLSRKLVSIDSELRSKLQVAANAEMKRQLEKAGTRARQSVSKNKTLRDKIAMTKNEHVMMMLGKDLDPIVAASYLNNDWSSLEEQFRSWTGLAQRQAVGVAAQLGGLNEEDAYVGAAVALSEGIDKGWLALKDSMDEIAKHLAYNPDPNVSELDAIAALNPDTLVPTGVIRCAVGVAGGSPLADFKHVLLDTGASVPAVPSTVAVGGVATGATIGNILTSAGATTSSYTWIHGPSPVPFIAHEDLDGLDFESFTDPALVNPNSFPDNSYYMVADHAGCLCDIQANWVMPENQ